ncbi:2OG-Fe(II) oxygenase [Myxococcus sp. RHSTA-1-4]|uniref:2OG-Fe(II) oxygenase n=1 Tax=Myxococcus sp. RHSTA-1-4 TaxID=2874601 RepID=UPI001CBED633|nr:2OG-Fe(II) oxygenase [Myxococcus sp. RHSTA-1-4]MBZ4417231.1 2OG-Fe(II) oxygenase [Myxococcus sp. RHSTA-1-4]
METLVQLTEAAVPAPLFRRLLRRVGALGTERLRQTYQTTFWYDFGPPANVVEEVILALRPGVVGKRRIAGVEWWLSRMDPTDVRVDFHQDRDEKLALRTGKLVHPRISSVLFLNRVRGGALVVTREMPDPENPSLAPSRLDTADLVAPRPNRLVLFDGTLTHGVLDAENRIPDGRLPGRARQRRTLAMNWWGHRPTDVPAWAETRFYRALAR